MQRTSESAPSGSLGLTLVAAILATVTSVLAWRLPIALESFRGMFTSFGVAPPQITLLVLDTPRFWWLLAAVSVATFIWVAAKPPATQVERRRKKIVVSVLIALTVAAYGFAAWAIYVPIFSMSKVV